MLERLSFLAFLVALAALLVSVAIYAWRVRRHDADVVGKGGQFLGGAGDFVMHWLMWVLSPLVTLSVARGLSADFCTYASLVFGVLSGVLIAIGRLEAGGWAIVLCGVADALDGRIARLTRTASDHGDFIDSTLDRFVEAATFLGFGIYLRATPWGAPLAGAALAGALIVSYARARGEVLHVLCTRGLMQRGERVVLTAFTCFLDPPLTRAFHLPPGTVALWVMALIALTTFITAIDRTIWITARLRGK